MEVSRNKLTDVGTRYEHLRDLSDSWEICIDIIKNKDMLSKDNKERMVKMLVAFEVLNLTIDSYADYKDIDVQYSLGRSVRSIPKAEEIKGGRGTPLCKSF